MSLRKKLVGASGRQYFLGLARGAQLLRCSLARYGSGFFHFQRWK